MGVYPNVGPGQLLGGDDGAERDPQGRGRRSAVKRGEPPVRHAGHTHEPRKDVDGDNPCAHGRDKICSRDGLPHILKRPYG
jgi:hypothetical protein